MMSAPTVRDDNLTVMEDKRHVALIDRRARPRGGRRTNDQGKPWYMRRRLWLAVASIAFVGWRRIAAPRQIRKHDIAA